MTLAMPRVQVQALREEVVSAQDMQSHSTSLLQAEDMKCKTINLPKY